MRFRGNPLVHTKVGSVQYTNVLRTILTVWLTLKFTPVRAAVMITFLVLGLMLKRELNLRMNYSFCSYFSHFFFQSHRSGRITDSKTAIRTTSAFVFPNWLMPKNVATVFGNAVNVVTMVR